MSLIVRCADLLAHKLRIGFPRGYTVLQNNASLKLTEAFERLQLTGDRGRDLTKKLEKNFQQESEILALC